MSEVAIPSLEEMLEAGVHFGHTTTRWHPKMEPFLFGSRNGVHIIDLAKTREKLAQAAAFIERTAFEGKLVLFVGVKSLAQAVVRAEAERAGSPFAVNRWIGGSLTNWPAVGGMVKHLKQLEDDESSGRLAKYTKKEQLEFARERERLEEAVGGLRNFSGKAGALFVVDVKYDKTAVAEAIKKGIPVAAIADSNINPTKITYPIPGNDDALKSITLITKVIADAVISGKEKARASLEMSNDKAQMPNEGQNSNIQ